MRNAAAVSTTTAASAASATSFPLHPATLSPSPTPVEAVANANNKIKMSKNIRIAASDEGYKDPVDRKIEELVRQSLRNLQNKIHPLQLPTLDHHIDNNDDADDDVVDDVLKPTTPWKTQDDMVIDPDINSLLGATTTGGMRRTDSASAMAKDNSDHDFSAANAVSNMGMLMTGTATTVEQLPIHNLNPNTHAQARNQSQKQRSNSMPEDLAMDVNSIITREKEKVSPLLSNQSCGTHHDTSTTTTMTPTGTTSGMETD